MNVLIIYLSSSLGLGMLLVFTSQLLPNRLNAWKIAALSLGLSITVLKYQMNWHSKSFMLYNLVFLFITLTLPMFFYQGKLWKRYMVFASFMILLTLCDAMGGTILSFHYGGIDAVFSDTIPLLIYNVFTVSLYMIFGAAAVFTWRMIGTRKFQPFFLLFFILPIGQLIMVYSFLFTTWTVWGLMGILMSLAADLVLLIYTISQEKKTELEEELRETRHTMELEQSHYRDVEQRREELQKIRHDFNNQLASIGRLIRSGEEASAQDMIHALAEEIADTKENPYCAIPVVNAILTEKAQACTAAGIGFEMELDIPVRLSVEQMHLCSIFSNLLDNAINACKQAQSSAPTIRLTSMVDGDYLFIKAINPSNKPSATPLPGHGYGSRILSDLAARYGGDYQSEYRDGMFTAVASLLAIDR